MIAHDCNRGIALLSKKHHSRIMSDLTEVEIFDCLATHFRLAAENCKKLALLPRKGANYKNLRDQLHIIEGAARQACYWREDTRWLAVGQRAAQAHRLSGDWLRKYKASPNVLRKLFLSLEEFMNFGYRLSFDLKDKRTGISGAILPANMQRNIIKSEDGPSMRISSGGIIIPNGVSV